MENNNLLKKYLDQSPSDLNRYVRLGETDGKNEIPSFESNTISQTELELLNDAENLWIKFKNINSDQLNKIEIEIEKTRKEIESEISITLDKISDDKNLELDLIESEYGSNTSEYKNLKLNFETLDTELSDIRKLVNRSLQVKFVSVYIPFMILLGIAEIPVNRLAFELFFEQSPIISLILSGAIGGLFVFFAHIIGSQLRNTQCNELNYDNTKTYFTLAALTLMSLLVMYFLGVMREQLVAVQAAANLNLEDLLNDDTQSAISGGITSIAIGSKGLMLLLLNIAIYVSGIIMAFLRHDPHPQYEEVFNKHTKAKNQLLKYQKNYELKQVEMLRDFNQKHSFNKTLQRKREAFIESIIRSKESLNLERILSKEKLIESIVLIIKNYRNGNIKTRKTPTPEYFNNSIYGIVEERIK
jgi:hypothetical protein